MFILLDGALPLSHALQALLTKDQLPGGFGRLPEGELGLTFETLLLSVVTPSTARYGH